MLEEKTIEFVSTGKKSFIFMQIDFIVLLLQHGRHEHTL